MSDRPDRRRVVAKSLSWAAALGAVAVLAIGFHMTRGGVDFASQFRLQQIHKSLGVLVFVLGTVWLAWCLLVPRRDAPAGRPYAAALRISRLAVLALVLVLPLSGWALVSAAVFKVPTFVFGAVWIPHIAMFDRLSDPEPAARLTRDIHLGLSVAFLAVAFTHALLFVGQGGWLQRRRR